MVTSLGNQNLIDNQLWQVYCDIYFSGYLRKQPLLHSLNNKKGAVISIWNPLGGHFGQLKNNQLGRAKRALLRHVNHTHFLLWGCSKDFTYRELSVFIEVNQNEAQRFAKLAQQLAYYYIEDGMLVLKSTYQVNTQQELGRLSKHIITRPNSLGLSNLTSGLDKGFGIENVLKTNLRTVQ
ncbi:hypothetical protein [Pseudoalteromonas sp. MMG005]|uniref:hypothetical protein n=1 Tax=Pseudoalteromonas sp. MMG005 TaxID=2822682 RepID=UPI001B39E96D|nr:hypothetical protein [Pseudoalteromonas sp. MMG005]MBQ4845354.1 hypothetical protein [Pseudoalteromonas sp. MMG005]